MDSTDDLLAALFARPDDEWRRGLDEACQLHPERAAELRRRFTLLERCGVTSPTAATTIGDAPERLGPYRLVRRLGDGGMGTVWLAQDEALGRDVAIKTIRPERLWFDKARDRFQREIEAVARLRHPGCVQIFRVGEADGVPWFAMEYVAGANAQQIVEALRERLTATPIERLGGHDLAAVLRQGGAQVESANSELFAEPWVRVAVRIALSAAEALAHAHARGVVHRDLKPSNLMVSPEGRVVVIDFGLAVAAGTSSLTGAGSQLGSIPYMAPEQLRGDTTAIGVRTDVRALGLCLRELLTLTATFDAKNEQLLRTQILDGALPAMRTWNEAVSRDLEVVVERAMHVDPGHRYASALDFAADLAAVLDDRPVQARRDALGARLRRQMRRRPALATAIGLLLLGLFVVPTIVTFAIAAQRDRAQTAELLARRREYVANVAAASAALQAGESEAARLRLDACAPELRRFEWHHLALALDASFAVIRVTTDAVTAVAVTPHGDLVAAGTRTGDVTMFELGSGRSVRTFRGGGRAIEALGFDRSGTSLFSIDDDQHLRAFDVTTGSLVRERARAAAHEHVRLAEPVERIVVSRGGGRLATIDPAAFAQSADLGLALYEWPTDDHFLVRGDEVVAGGSSGTCAWSLTSGAVVATLASSRRVSVLGASDDPPTVAVLDGPAIVLWSPGEPTGTSTSLVGHRPVKALFPRQGRFVVVPCDDGQILVRDPETASWRTLCGHRGAITSAAEVPRTSTFVTGSTDGTVRLWSTTAVQNRIDLAGGGWGRGLTTDAANHLWVGTENSIAAAVDPETGAVAWQARHEHWVNALAVVESLQTLVASVGTSLRFWSTVDGTSRGTLAMPAECGHATRAVTAPSGSSVAIVDRLGHLTIVDVASREITFHDRVHQDVITDLAFTATGHVLTAGADGWIVRTNPVDRSRSRLLQHATAACRTLALDGNVLYTSEHAIDAKDGLLCERDATTGRLLRSQTVSDAVTVLRVLDAERLVAGTENGHVVFWDRALLVPVFETPVFSHRARNLVVSSRGDWVAVIGHGGDPVVLRTTPSSTTADRVSERLQIADLRDRIRTAFGTLPPWRPRIEAALAADPDLDAAARARCATLLPPTGTWELGIASHEAGEPPAPSPERLVRLRALLAALSEAIATPGGLDLLLRTGHGLVAIRVGEPRATLASTAPITMDPQQGPTGSEGQFRAALHFARGMAHHQLGDDAAARRDRDALAAMVAGAFATDQRAHLFLRELDDALR